ncbi:hypothetical protein C5B42_00580, partial [Candidatus Cerribacteria bacterium 'Amazon FNV 2010 28 9']
MSRETGSFTPENQMTGMTKPFEYVYTPAEGALSMDAEVPTMPEHISSPEHSSPTALEIVVNPDDSLQVTPVVNMQTDGSVYKEPLEIKALSVKDQEKRQVLQTIADKVDAVANWFAQTITPSVESQIHDINLQRQQDRDLVRTMF